MGDVVQLKPTFDSALAEATEGAKKFLLVTMDQDMGCPEISHFNMNLGEMAFAILMLQKEILIISSDPDDGA